MESNVPSTQTSLIQLRKRLMDLQAIGILDESQHGLYQQTILQLWQETERRRQTCMAQAETLRAQAAAAEAQAHAFSAMSSMTYAIVNGYIELEEKRIREERERATESTNGAEAETSNNAPIAASSTREASSPSAPPHEEAKPNGRRKRT